MYSFPNLEPVCCSMSGSNCCFLTCIYVSLAAGKVVWYSHFFKNFPQFVVIHTDKGFCAVNKAEVDIFHGKGNGNPLQYSFLEITWTEEPGRLQSMGSWRVRHDWVTSLSFFTFMHWRRKWQPTPVSLPGESWGRWSLVGCRLWHRTELDTTGAT